MYTIPKVLGFHKCAIQLLLSRRLGGGEVLAIMACTGKGEAPSEMDTFFMPLVFVQRWGICIVEVYERVWKSVIPLYRKALRANGW